MLAALLRTGWQLKRQSGSHRTLAKPDWPDVVFAFHDEEEIGPRMPWSDREAHRPYARRPVGLMSHAAAL